MKVDNAVRWLTHNGYTPKKVLFTAVCAGVGYGISKYLDSQGKSFPGIMDLLPKDILSLSYKKTT